MLNQLTKGPQTSLSFHIGEKSMLDQRKRTQQGKGPINLGERMVSFNPTELAGKDVDIPNQAIDVLSVRQLYFMAAISGDIPRLREAIELASETKEDIINYADQGDFEFHLLVPSTNKYASSNIKKNKEIKEEDTEMPSDSLVINHELSILVEDQPKAEENLKTITTTSTTSQPSTNTEKKEENKKEEKEKKEKEKDDKCEKGGKNVHYQVITGDTALHLAAEYGHHKVCYHILLQTGAIVDIPNVVGSTALHRACSVGYLEVVKTLLTFQANVLAQNKIGNTPLHCAIFSNKIDIAKFLLVKHAENVQDLLNIENKLGLTPVDYCRTTEMNDVLKTYILTIKPMVTKTLSKHDEKDSSPLLTTP